jgi:Domain of unknown function (DUF6265)
MKNSLLAMLLIPFLFAASAAAAEPAAMKIDNVAWLAGRWQSPPGERTNCEEHWSAPAGGAMVGMFRLLAGGRPSVYEILLLEEESDGVWMRLRHFGPQMTAREQEPLKLKLTEATESKLLFENPAESLPKRIVYALAGDELTATVETARGGKPVSFSLKMQRAK